MTWAVWWTCLTSECTSAPNCSIKLDMAIYDERGDCNVFRAMKGSLLFIKAMLHFVRFQRVSSMSFSTGILFWYWPFYATAEAEEIKTDTFYNKKQFGEYSVRDTYVTPFYATMKEELVGSGLIDIESFNEDIVAKGK